MPSHCTIFRTPSVFRGVIVILIRILLLRDSLELRKLLSSDLHLFFSKLKLLHLIRHGAKMRETICGGTSPV